MQKYMIIKKNLWANVNFDKAGLGKWPKKATMIVFFYI